MGNDSKKGDDNCTDDCADESTNGCGCCAGAYELAPELPEHIRIARVGVEDHET